MSITVLAYSHAWPAMFEREAACLRVALRPWLVEGVHHIGSTAVPGLAAKPILDMMAGVQDLEDSRNAVPVLAALGYRHADHRPAEALWFYKQEGEDLKTRTYQLHLTCAGSDLWRERIAFRDALRADPALLAEYQALKCHLAAGTDALTKYTPGKRTFVAAVLEQAGIHIG